MSNLRQICAIFACLILCSIACFGQAVNGSLLGTVNDASGAAVADAKVTATEPTTGTSRTVTTNQSGNYTFPDLSPGVYNVSVEQTGFKRFSRNNVDVLVNTSVRVDAALQIGSVSETIEVNASAPLLQTERADTGRTVETKQLEDLPVAGPSRNFQSLLNLVPGTSPVFRPHSEFFNPQNSISTQVNGQSRLGNNLQFEGVDNNERTGLLSVYIPAIEALQTVDVSTSNFEAELGRATGAVTNVLLKSGTNDFHGQAYWFNRVSALSARAFYDPIRPNFVYNYVGGQFGGAIIKNRTFFFTDYLRIIDRRYNVDRYTLPTDAARTGNLSGYSSVIYDPRTGNADGSGRTPFAGNIIPADRIDPVAKRILALIPQQNLAGTQNNYYTRLPFTRDTDQIDGKVDHNFNEENRISVRYSYFKPTTVDASSFGDAGGPHAGGFSATGVQGTHNGAINFNRVFSPTLITEIRFGVNRYRNDAKQTDYGKSDATTLGVPGVNVNDFTSGQVGIEIGGFSNPIIGFSPSLPWVRAETNIDFVNHWTRLVGNHTIKFGAEVRRIRDDLIQTQVYSPRGLYRFGTAQTSISGAGTSLGNNFASFLLGLPNEVGRDLLIASPAYRAYEYFFYVGDKWVVTPKLTLDLGLRWELYPPATPAHPGGFSNYDPTTNSLVVAGVGNNPSNLGRKTQYKDFAPRIGIAYRFNEKTVVRTGFGISYAPYPDNTYAYNFPVKQNNAYNASCSFCPATLPNGQTATLSAGFPAPATAVIPANGIIPNADPNQSYEVINKNFREPYVESWNFAIQRALPANFSLDMAYVGNHGVAQPAAYNLNASTTVGLDVAGQPLFQQFGRKAATTYRYQGFSSNYNALQVKLDKRYSNGLAITTSYTYAKAMGYQSEDAGLKFYINPRRNYSRLDFDRTHSFVESFVYDLPFGKGKAWMKSGPASYILGGWQMNGILSIYSGTPLNFAGNSAGLKAPGNSNTLNHYGPIEVTKGTGRNATWFSPTVCSSTVTTGCFAQPGALEFGNLGPNVISGPGSWTLNGSLFKTVKISERLEVQLRGEAYSVVNTPNWNNPDTGIGNSTFGQITGAGGNRQVQLGAKIVF